MTRTGKIRLGSILLVLALASPPTRGALIPHRLSPASFSDAGASAWWDVAREAGEFSIDARGEFPGWTIHDAARDRAPDWRPSDAEPHAGWTLDDRAEALLMASAIAFGEAEARAEEEGGPTPEPPLVLAALAGAMGWTLCRRRSARPTPMPMPAPRHPVASRSPSTAARPTGTAIVPARFETPAAARLLILPANFVEVSTTTLPVRRPGAVVRSPRREIDRTQGMEAR